MRTVMITDVRWNLEMKMIMRFLLLLLFYLRHKARFSDVLNWTLPCEGDCVCVWPFVSDLVRALEQVLSMPTSQIFPSDVWLFRPLCWMDKGGDAGEEEKQTEGKVQFAIQAFNGPTVVLKSDLVGLRAERRSSSFQMHTWHPSGAQSRTVPTPRARTYVEFYFILLTLILFTSCSASCHSPA